MFCMALVFSMKTLELSLGCVAMVDDEDFEWLSKFSCSTQRVDGKLKYGAISMRTTATGRTKKYLLHRIILGITDPKVYVDHKDGNGFNDQRSNLRIATNAQNQYNAKKHKDNTSGYKGVRWSKAGKCWIAQIQHNKKERHIGSFKCPIEAAKAYDAKAIELHGEFAKPNFPI
jgi:hypothetical protein